jgi:predicted ABC-type ATPase
LRTHLASAATLTRPVFYLLAGPNGAGKSTLYTALKAGGKVPADAEFVNADVHEAAYLQHIADPLQRSEAARNWADMRREALLRQGKSFVSETVFSHPSKLALIQEAQAKGYFVLLLVVALDQPERLLARVSQRVLEGGHNVSAQRILARYPRTIALLAQAVRLADAAVLHDSFDAQPGAHKVVATCQGRTTRILHPVLPQWAQIVLQLPH